MDSTQKIRKCCRIFNFWFRVISCSFVRLFQEAPKMFGLIGCICPENRFGNRDKGRIAVWPRGNI